MKIGADLHASKTFASYVIEILRNYAKHTVERALPMVQRTTSLAFECVGADVMWIVLAIWESRWNLTALISFIGYRFEFRVSARRFKEILPGFLPSSRLQL